MEEWTDRARQNADRVRVQCASATEGSESTAAARRAKSAGMGQGEGDWESKSTYANARARKDGRTDADGLTGDLARIWDARCLLCQLPSYIRHGRGRSVGRSGMDGQLINE